MAATKDIWRPTLSSDEVFYLLDMMETAKAGNLSAFDPRLQDYYIKLDKLAYDIGKGHRKPAYVATGVRKESAINLDSLGADVPMPPPVSDTRKPVRTEKDLNRDNAVADKMMELMSTGMDLDEAQIQAEQWYDSGSSNSAELNNSGTPDISTDNDTIHTLLMSAPISIDQL